jgi:hypothetical protein
MMGPSERDVKIIIAGYVAGFASIALVVIGTLALAAWVFARWN